MNLVWENQGWLIKKQRTKIRSRSPSNVLTSLDYDVVFMVLKDWLYDILILTGTWENQCVFHIQSSLSLPFRLQALVFVILLSVKLPQTVNAHKFYSIPKLEGSSCSLKFLKMMHFHVVQSLDQHWCEHANDEA